MPKMIPIALIFVSSENTPVTNRQPENASKSEITFCALIFSLNKKADISITNIGAVYKSMDATDRDAYVIHIK